MRVTQEELNKALLKLLERGERKTVQSYRGKKGRIIELGKRAKQQVELEESAKRKAVFMEKYERAKRYRDGGAKLRAMMNDFTAVELIQLLKDFGVDVIHVADKPTLIQYFLEMTYFEVFSYGQ